MVKINYCPSCGTELTEKSFICPTCSLDIEELFAKGYLLASDSGDNSIELFKGNEEMIVFDDENPQDEIVIVVPQDGAGDEIEIDFDELGIDIGKIDGDINIVIEVDADEFEADNEFLEGKEYIPRPNEWFFDDDPYGIVYYEFVNDED